MLRATFTAARVAPQASALADRQMNSLDPLSAEWSSEEHVPGQVWTVHSPQQLQEVLDKHAQQLVVLMCKSKTCRPCKTFMKKYMAVAQRYQDVLLLQIFGDESADTRKLMVTMKVKMTPTFELYRGGGSIGRVTGVSELKLQRAIVDAMTPAEHEAHAGDIADLEAAEEMEEADRRLKEAESVAGH